MMTINNQQGATVNVYATPRDYFTSPTYKGQPWRKAWKKTIRIWKGHLYLTISNKRVKLRPRTDMTRGSGKAGQIMHANRQKLYERQEHRCARCQCELTYQESELHHILPVARFPELRTSIRNGVVLCHRCHKEIHVNPYLNIRLMEQKAQELGINLKERFDP